MIIFPVLLVGAQLTWTVADQVPTLNAQPSCRAGANGSARCTCSRMARRSGRPSSTTRA
jgi:hypothetical protein